jgi:hypothetical protein
VAKVLDHLLPTSTIAFCQTKIQCDELVAFLKERGLSAAALHGDLEQRDRDQVLTLFANRSLSILVATDVAARGIDAPGWIWCSTSNSAATLKCTSTASAAAAAPAKKAWRCPWSPRPKPSAPAPSRNCSSAR